MNSAIACSHVAGPRPTAAKPTVVVVDDDISVREALETLIAKAGWQPELYSSAQEFLERRKLHGPTCLVLDVGLPDLDGLELRRRVGGEHCELPTIVITGRGDIPTTVRAMKAGAVEFLTKPFMPEVLVEAIRSALERSRRSIEREDALNVLRLDYHTLSARERQVLALVVQGKLNKQIAHDLAISEVTVKVHRGKVMQKMRAKSLADLVTIAARLGIDVAGLKLRSIGRSPGDASAESSGFVFLCGMEDLDNKMKNSDLAGPIAIS